MGNGGLKLAKSERARENQFMSSTILARGALARAAAQPRALGAAPNNARNMATLREIELRLKSVRNIEKITKVRRDYHFHGILADGPR